METALLSYLRVELESLQSSSLGTVRANSVSGGCIHSAYRLTTDGGASYFVKVNSLDQALLFTAETAALKVLAEAAAIRVPRPLLHGTFNRWSYLVLEHLQLRSDSRSSGADGYTLMGQQLAALHRVLAPTGQFGWPESNFIGATPQPNRWHSNWIDFWRDERLGHQFTLAQQRGHPFNNTDKLLDRLPTFIEGYEPAPSLLHGDLWGGNASFDDTGAPVLYDPASYYGDRETDLAFTQLFGGFPSSFYAAYDEVWPRHPGWQRRQPLYNLYHLLNHDHLFGGHYHDQAQGVINRLARDLVRPIPIPIKRTRRRPI